MGTKSYFYDYGPFEKKKKKKKIVNRICELKYSLLKVISDLSEAFPTFKDEKIINQIKLENKEKIFLFYYRQKDLPGNEPGIFPYPVRWFLQDYSYYILLATDHRTQANS